MKTFITALLIGILLGTGGYWAWHARYCPPGAGKLSQSLPKIDGQAKERIERVVEGKLEALELQADSVRKELKETGRVVRRRARDLCSSMMDTAVDMRISAAIKAKLAADHELSAWKISVNTSSRVVTLSGTVSSADLIGKAVMRALEEENVTMVISTIQVREADSTETPSEQKVA